MKVLLTNCTRSAGVIIARSLTRGGHEVVGADDRALPFGMRSRHVSRQHRVPTEDDPDFADSLLAVLARERPDVLIPFSGAEPVAARSEEFAATVDFLVPDAAVLGEVRDKAALSALCGRFGVHAPETFSRPQAERILEGAAHDRLVVKPRRGRGGGDHVRFVRSPGELEEATASIERSGEEAVITDAIPGGTESEGALHLLFDRESRLIAWFSLRKTLQSPLHVGITAAAVSTHDIALVQTVTPMLESLGWRGAIDVEWKLDPRDGVSRLVEMNPRFSGAIGFPIALGIDMAGLCVAASRGDRLPVADRATYAAGVRYINPAPYLRALPARVRELGLRRSATRIAEECSGRVVAPAWELRDPAPLVGKALSAVLRPVGQARPERGEGTRDPHHHAV